MTAIDGRRLAFFVGAARTDVTILIDESITVVIFLVTAILDRTGCHFSPARHVATDVVTVEDARATDAHAGRAVRSRVAGLADSRQVGVDAVVDFFVATVQRTQLGTGARPSGSRHRTLAIDTHFVAVTEAKVGTGIAVGASSVGGTTDRVATTRLRDVALVVCRTTDVRVVVQ